MAMIVSISDVPAKLGDELASGEIGVCINPQRLVQVAMIVEGVKVAVSLRETEWTHLVDFIDRQAALMAKEKPSGT